MTPLILFGLIVGLPFLISLILRIKPLFLFIAIITGYFWATFLGESAELVLRSMVHVNNPDVIIRLVLFLLPIIFTALFMRGSVAAAALPFQLALILGNSLLLATFLIEFLTLGVQQAIYENPIGSVFHQSHDVGIAAIATLQLGVLFFSKPKHHDTHHGKKRH